MSFWWTWPAFGAGIWAWFVLMHLIGWMIFVGVVVWIAMVLFRPSTRSAWPVSGAPAPPHSAREQLDQRYARGEISREEYLQKKTDMGG